MDGLDAIRELRSWESQNRPAFRQYVVGISAHASGSDADKGISLGMDGYKSKPLILQDLREIAECEEVAAAGELLDSKKRSKTIEPDDPRPTELCLIATEDTMVQQEVMIAVQENAWIAVAAWTKGEFLEKLRSRNWDAVILDGDVAEFPMALQEFREWEERNRVRRQRNVCLLSSGFKQQAYSMARMSLVELPRGVDCVLGKPKTSEEVEKMLDTVHKNATSRFTPEDIVTR